MVRLAGGLENQRTLVAIVLECLHLTCHVSDAVAISLPDHLAIFDGAILEMDVSGEWFELFVSGAEVGLLGLIKVVVSQT